MQLRFIFTDMTVEEQVHGGRDQEHLGHVQNTDSTITSR